MMRSKSLSLLEVWRRFVAERAGPFDDTAPHPPRLSWPSATAPTRCISCGMPLVPGDLHSCQP